MTRHHRPEKFVRQLVVQVQQVDAEARLFKEFVVHHTIQSATMLDGLRAIQAQGDDCEEFGGDFEEK